MMEKLFSLLNNIHFTEPVKLQLLAVPLAFFILTIIAWSLWLLRRPKRTYGSRYRLFGSYIASLFFTVALAFFIGAWAMPFITAGNLIVKRGNVEVVFIIDYSSSMLLKDTGVARINIASRELIKLPSFEILKNGDRAAIFVLGASGVRYLPLTSDLSNFVAEASRLGIPTTLLGSNIYWDSDIGGTLERVYTSLDRQDAFAEFKEKDPPNNWRPEIKQNRLVVFMGDGDYFNYISKEEAESEAEDKKNFEMGLNEFRKRGLKIYPIGIGTRTGGKMLDILKGYKRELEYDIKLEEDLKGQESRLNAYYLEYMRNATGAGKLFLMENSNADASNFLKAVIDSHRNITIEPEINQEREDLWPHFTFAALLFIALAIKFI